MLRKGFLEDTALADPQINGWKQEKSSETEWLALRFFLHTAVSFPVFRVTLFHKEIKSYFKARKAIQEGSKSMVLSNLHRWLAKIHGLFGETNDLGSWAAVFLFIDVVGFCGEGNVLEWTEFFHIPIQAFGTGEAFHT